VMQGVAEAHAQGLLHGELKPASVFLASSMAARTPTPKVLDFVTAKEATDAKRRRANTLHTTTFSDYQYMACEQLHMESDIDGRADVYALGVLLYRTLTGLFPYRAENPVDLALEMAHAPHVPLTERDTMLSSDLESVVARALACDREQRYPTVGAFAAALAPHALGEGVSELSPGLPVSARSRRQWVKTRLPRAAGRSHSGWIAKLSPWSWR
jgi:serine/threonine protein kinase